MRQQKNYEIWKEGKITGNGKQKPAKLLAENLGTNFKHALGDYRQSLPKGQQKRLDVPNRTWRGQKLFQSEELANMTPAERLAI